MGSTFRLPLLALLVLGCEDSVAKAPPAAAVPTPLEHDFGTIPHGQTRQHTLVVPVPGAAAGKTPVAFQSGCSCARTRFLARARGSTPRDLDVLPMVQRTLQQDEELLLELTVDTRLKEAVDLPRVTTRAAVLLQDVAGERTQIAVVFHYAIDARIAVLPVAHVDLGALARTHVHQQTLELHPDGQARVGFGPVSCSDPRLSASLRAEEGLTLLDLRFAPGEASIPGPVRLQIDVQTDLEDGYVLRIPVSGQLLPDIVVQPLAHLSFGRIDLAAPAEQFVLVTDHDRRRKPGFVVQSIADSRGRALAEHFDVRVEPIEGDDRTTRVVLAYLGRLRGEGFRGTLRLAKPDQAAVTVDITFVGFRNP